MANRFWKNVGGGIANALVPGIDLTADFFWIDDSPTPKALEVLAQHGCEHRWIEARVDHDPVDLLRVHHVLDERLSASSGASRAATD